MVAIIGTLPLQFWITTVLLIVVLHVIKFCFDKGRLFILGNKLPGPKGWPIIGNALVVLEHNLNILDLVTEFNKEYGLVRLWLGPMLNVFICTPEDAEIYYSSPALLDRSEHFKFLEYLLGKGLLTANGSHWKKSKKLMEPAFRYSSLRSFVAVFQEKTDILVRLLENEVGKPAFPVYDYIKNCSFDIISKAMCDVELNAQMQNVQILKDAEVLMTYVTSRMYSLWQQNDLLYRLTNVGKDFFLRLKSAKSYIDDMISAKKKFLKENQQSFEDSKNEENIKKQPFIQRLIEQEEWNDDEIRDHITTMVATGYETSSCEICFVLVLLGIHQDVQEKLYQEISSVSQNGLHDIELARLEYLDKVIKESMRIFPIAPILFRKANEDVQFGEHLVPKGAAIGINIFAIHRSPKYYENPDVFNPENFSKEKVASRHPFAFVPFGMGVRRCIGEKFAWMALRIIITKILLNYKIECTLKLEEIPVRLDITLKMTNGFPIRLLKRVTSNC